MTDHQQPTAKPEGEGAPVDGDERKEAVKFFREQWKMQASAVARNGNKPVDHERIVRFIDMAIAALSASPPVPAVAGEEAKWSERIAELVADGDGIWRACSGCQEGVDGYVSERDYPHSRTFQCQPGGGCRECGGLGVIWDNTDYNEMAEAMLADMRAEEARPTPSADQSGVLEALADIVSLLRSGALDRAAVLPALDRADAALAAHAASIGGKS